MKEKIFVRSAYNYDTDEASAAAALGGFEPTRAQQHMAEECDLNVIMERFGQGYDMPKGIVAPTFGDFTGAGSYQDMLNVIATANEAFDQLPARVRDRFANNPAAFVEFCSTPGNEAELERMELLPPRVPGELVNGPREPGVPPVGPTPSPEPSPAPTGS